MKDRKSSDLISQHDKLHEQASQAGQVFHEKIKKVVILFCHRTDCTRASFDVQLNDETLSSSRRSKTHINFIFLKGKSTHFQKLKSTKNFFGTNRNEKYLKIFLNFIFLRAAKPRRPA